MSVSVSAVLVLNVHTYISTEPPKSNSFYRLYFILSYLNNYISLCIIYITNFGSVSLCVFSVFILWLILFSLCLFLCFLLPTLLSVFLSVFVCLHVAFVSLCVLGWVYI